MSEVAPPPAPAAPQVVVPAVLVPPDGAPKRFVGVHTTELVLVVLTDVAVVAASAVAWLPPRWAAVAAAIANGSYALSRGLSKVGSAGSR